METKKCESQFVDVIFTNEEWSWLEKHLASLPEDEMILDVLSALDGATIHED